MSAAGVAPMASAAASATLNRPPSLCMKPLPMSAESSPTATSPPITLTSKEWIVPPRPKPGRKPATDTPPTKRKAQNRAAQRAFRERRAARVGELEEQMKEIEDQHEAEQESLRSEVTDLEKSLEQCQAELSSWIAKCRQLETELAQAQQQIARSHGSGTVSPTHPSDPEPVGCGNCTLESHCQCIDDVVQGMNNDQNHSHSHQRSYSPEPSSNKKIKLESTDPNSLEIDFTTAFAKGSTHTRTSHSSARAVDPCGFCQDGTPCICAEMAAEQERQAMTRPNSPTINRTGPRQMAQFTPPPSEGDVAHTTLPRLSNCASGPGTCTQCLSDPNLTLFCKSLAAARGASGCCGGKGATGGCCQTNMSGPVRTTRSRAAGVVPIQLPEPNARNPVTLSCADAYTALSRHAGYERASGDMASWMPKLQANQVSAEGRPAMEIDAANVMAVLKDFDRRFGANT